MDRANDKQQHELLQIFYNMALQSDSRLSEPASKRMGQPNRRVSGTGYGRFGSV
jgi:hypothetical protein